MNLPANNSGAGQPRALGAFAIYESAAWKDTRQTVLLGMVGVTVDEILPSEPESSPATLTINGRPVKQDGPSSLSLLLCMGAHPFRNPS